MSSGLPSIRPDPRGATIVNAKEGPMGVPEMMLHGFRSVKSDITAAHPLEFSEQQWNAQQEKLDMAMLRNIQGMHAPLRLNMERNTAKKMQRLPGLHSSNIMYNNLTGKDDTLEFEDILNNPFDSEVMGQPHAMMEKRLGLL